MSHDWLMLLRTHTERFAEVVESGDPGSPIGSCPGWSLHDLADHLGGVHQWAAHAVVAGTPIFDPEPADGDLATWYRRHASHLAKVLEARPAHAPAWTFDESDPTAGFWRRRQVHETVIHTWDAETACDEPRAIEPLLAWDGVEEVAEVLYPRQVRLGRIAPLTDAVHLVATDAPGSLTIGRGDPVEVRHPAEVLLRLLWHRVDPVRDGIDPRSVALLATAVTP